MWSRRLEVSYALQRRAALLAVRDPDPLNWSDPCDADPLLISSARHHGEPADIACPICESDDLRWLHYIFGDQLGQFSGRIKTLAELDELENQVGEFTVRKVEVCPDCGWNHMIEAYVLGDGRKRRAPRRQETVEDIYG